MLYELPVTLAESFDEVKGTQLSSAPYFHVDPITHSSQKSGTKLNPIAQNFIPVVVLAPTLYEERDFTYYLPLFAHSRTKDFFLLI